MITHVAFKDAHGRVWSLPKPNRHGDVVKIMPPERLEGSQDGFLDSSGRFLTRKEAWWVAHENNQLLPPYHPLDPSKRAGSPSDQPAPLASEDIW